MTSRGNDAAHRVQTRTAALSAREPGFLERVVPQAWGPGDSARARHDRFVGSTLPPRVGRRLPDSLSAARMWLQ